jgi:hypothetical protein
LLGETARALLAGELLADCVNGVRDACHVTVPENFRCFGSIPSDAVKTRYGVGPAANRLSPQTSPSSTTYVVICDQSASTGEGGCDADVALRDVFARYLEAGAPPSGHVVVVPTRESYGATTDAFTIDIPSNGDVEHRVAAVHESAALARAWLAEHAGTGSAIVEAIAVGVRTARQRSLGDKVVVVWSDARQVSPGVDLSSDRGSRSLRRFERNASEVLPSGSLTGAVIEWHGLHGHGTTPMEHRELRASVEAALANAGARAVSFVDHEPGTLP